MTDLEMTRLAAEAMGYQIRTDRDDGDIWCNDSVGGKLWYYDPLHDDAQAMQLVKRFGLRMSVSNCLWTVIAGKTKEKTVVSEGNNKDLNRAIVQCVSKMQASKL